MEKSEHHKQSRMTTIRPPMTGAPLILCASGEDRQRLQEIWTETNERLLLKWSKNWSKQSDAHTQAARTKKKYHHLVTLPLTLIPLVCTLFTSKNLIDENHTVILIGLVSVAILNSINQVMKFESACHQHEQANSRLQDLISDTEEVLSKTAAYRPDPDVFILNLKTRSDFNSRIAPDVKVADDSDDEDEF